MTRKKGKVLGLLRAVVNFLGKKLWGAIFSCNPSFSPKKKNLLLCVSLPLILVGAHIATIVNLPVYNVDTLHDYEASHPLLK
jgi:hypothetical protein